MPESKIAKRRRERRGRRLASDAHATRPPATFGEAGEVAEVLARIAAVRQAEPSPRVRRTRWTPTSDQDAHG